MRTPGFGVSRFSSTSGVLPTSSRRLPATVRLGATGHRREEDDGGPGCDRCVEPTERAHVLALDVDVHAGRNVVVLDELRAQPGEARHQVVEQLAHRSAVGGNLALAADLGAKSGWNANCRHACVGLPESDLWPGGGGCAAGASSRAELHIVDVLGDRRVLAADRAVRVAAEIDLVELALERVEEEQPARERLADPERE